MDEIDAADEFLDRGEDGSWIVRTASPISAFAGTPGTGPSVATDGALAVVFHGVLHRRAPSTALEPAPAERVLDEYRQHGTAAFETLRGAFAVVVVDSERDEVLVVRDHMGVVPLFWSEGHHGIVASPSARALAAHSEVASGLNIPAIGEWVLLRWLDVAETLFDAVHRIPAGHYLRASGSRRDIVRYWQPLVQSSKDWASEDELAEFDAIFTTAVKRCLALGPVGIFLSGGLDSVSVAAVATTESDRSGLPAPVALSLAFPHESCNEEDVQRRVAVELGMPQVMLGLYEAAGDHNVLRESLAMSATWDQPLTNYWIPAYRALIRAGADRGCTVVLTGTGGDEWLGVTPYYAANLLRRGDIVGLYRLWRGTQRSTSVPPGRMAVNLLWRFGARDVLLGAASRALSKVFPDALQRRRTRLIDSSFPSWAIPDADIRVAIRERMLAARDDHSERDIYHRELATSLAHPLVSLEAEEYYERGAREGAALRHPFLDPDVVEFLARMPPELLTHAGRSKGPVRDLVARRLPGLGFERQKKIVATPFAGEYLLDNLPTVWEEFGGLRSLASHGLVDQSLIDSELARVVRERDDVAVHKLWYQLTLESWVRSAST